MLASQLNLRRLAQLGRELHQRVKAELLHLATYKIGHPTLAYT